MPGLLRHERGGRHARLRVDFEKNDAPPLVIEPKIGASDSAAAKYPMRTYRDAHCITAHILGDRRGQNMLRSAFRIFSLVIVKARLRDDLCQAC